MSELAVHDVSNMDSIVKLVQDMFPVDLGSAQRQIDLSLGSDSVTEPARGGMGNFLQNLIGEKASLSYRSALRFSDNVSKKNVLTHSIAHSLASNGYSKETAETLFGELKVLLDDFNARGF